VSGTRLFFVAVLLVAVFAGAALIAGYPADLTPGESDEARHVQQGPHGGDDEAVGTGDRPAEAPPGVQVAQDGLRLSVERSTSAPDARTGPFSFRILDAQGRAVRDFEVQHEREMHFIVVRRDLAGFQHLHPAMKPNGTWTTEVAFGEGGTYRVFADFARDGEQRTLGADVQVAGLFRPRPLPAPARVVRSDGGLEIVLRADPEKAGHAARLEFEVRDRGRVVTERLQPYLGAKGHLVALREGDLAYLHTHPERDEPAFALNYPSAGAYRLFAQLRYQGRVHTAAFTRWVAE
jgi:hypothetical protein